MRPAIIVLFVVAMVISTTQTFRHIYVKFLEPQGSILDQFRSETDIGISDAGDLEELAILYADANNMVKEYEDDSTKPIVEHHNRNSVSPYKERGKIEKEIRNREYDQRQLSKLWFFWGGGLIGLVLGIVSFNLVNKWLGFAMIVTGFSEMLVWTSPLFHNRILSYQFEHLLNAKLSLSVITWLVLLGVWLLIEKKGLLRNDS